MTVDRRSSGVDGFHIFWHWGNEGEDWAKIAKGEFTKGLGPSIKEDMWQAIKVLGKVLKYFESSIQLDHGHRF
jgi:hypothetical protein